MIKELNEVYIDRDGNVVIVFETGKGFYKFVDMPVEVASELKAYLNELL